MVSEYVIRGNTAVLKCFTPSFVADFVKVEAWVTSDGDEYLLSNDTGGRILDKIIFVPYPCNPIPSYTIWKKRTKQSWHIFSVVNQFYEAEILTEYVIRGNAAVLKCSIPSFVADFVKVEAWIDEEGTVITYSEDLGNHGFIKQWKRKPPELRRS